MPGFGSSKSLKNLIKKTSKAGFKNKEPPPTKTKEKKKRQKYDVEWVIVFTKYR